MEDEGGLSLAPEGRTLNQVYHQGGVASLEGVGQDRVPGEGGTCRGEGMDHVASA